MNEFKAGTGDVSNLLSNVYRCTDKSNWYSDVVDAYDRTRPRYPTKLINRVREIAKLQPGKKILEIGCGPGIATLELAKLGLEIVAVEPNLTACQLARRKCANYPQVEFIDSTFEELKLGGDKFDAVVATTSFHWITPKIRTKKTASILKDDGYLILLWNTPPQPYVGVLQKLKPIYRAYAPRLTQQEDVREHQQNLAKFEREVLDSGYYCDLICDRSIAELDYTIDEYLTLLTTLSPYISLKSSQRDILLVELEKVLRSQCGYYLKLSYLSMFQIARKTLS